MLPQIPSRSSLAALSALLAAFASAALPATAAPQETSAPAEPAAPAAPAAAPASPLAADLDAYLDSIYGADEPGAAVLVARGGETVLREGYGMADLELGVELRPDHVFRIGSITKQFTAVGILMLAQEGELSLDDEITEYLPDYPTRGHRITVEHLLHHTSGIRSYTGMPEYRAMMREDVELDSLIAGFRDEPLDFAPGEDWSYSNSGYVLLGKILEVASGEDYADFVRERIFEPAGMTDSYYGDASRIIPGRAEGYARTDDGWRNAEYLSMTLPHAAGALLSTVDDLARWYGALESGDLVEPALLERAYTPAVLEDGRSTGYGYGWQIGRAFGRRTIEHGGGINGFLTYALRIPEEDLLVVVLTNRVDDDPAPAPVALELARRALGEPAEPETLSLPPEALEEYVGVYRVNEQERRAITLEDGRLYSRRTGGEKYEILPVAEDVFVYPGSRTRAVFERDASGEVVRVRMRPRAGPETVAPRTDETSLRPEAMDLPAEVLERYTGDYRYGPDRVLTIVLVDGGLRGRLTGQPEVTLEAESETRFRAVEVPAWVEFEVGEDGRAEAAVVIQGGRETRAPRIR